MLVKNIREFKIYFAIILILFLPEGLIVNLNFSSISFGSLLSYLILIVILQLGNFPRLTSSRYFYAFYFIAIMIIIFSLISGSLIHNNFAYSRFFQSLFLLIIMIYSAYLLANRLYELNNIEIDRLLKKIAITLILLTPVTLLNWYVLDGLLTVGETVKKMIFFTEPSHYAFVSAPFFIYYLLSSNKISYIFFSICLFFSAIFLRNITIILPLLIGLFIRNKKYFLSLIFLSILILPFFVIFLDTLNTKLLGLFDPESRDLTVLVYLQGWQYIASSFENFLGAGIGFQQLGQVRLDSSAQTLLELMNYPFNQNDGSFLFSKLTVEFGIIGIILTFYYLKNLITIYLNIDKIKNSFWNIFLSSTYISLFILMFVRSSSYFNPAIFFFIVSVFGMNLNKHRVLLNK